MKQFLCRLYFGVKYFYSKSMLFFIIFLLQSAAFAHISLKGYTIQNIYFFLLYSQFNYIYLKQCVESSPIVPIQQEWLDHMLMLVPESLKEGKEREELVQSLINEVSHDFEKSMKRYLGKQQLTHTKLTCSPAYPNQKQKCE